jgi:hypothetical protein
MSSDLPSSCESRANDQGIEIPEDLVSARRSRAPFLPCIRQNLPGGIRKFTQR